MMSKLPILTLTLAGLCLLPGWAGQASAQEDEAQQQAEVAKHANTFRDIKQAVAVLLPTKGNDVRGVIRFQEQPDGKVRVTGRIRGLEPDSTHGFHVHEFGDMTSADGTSAGGHYDPEGHGHALPPETPRHAGDMGNIEANEEGVAVIDQTFDNFTVAGLENPIIGRGVVVHAQRDNGENPSGNAGKRLATGVVGVAQQQE